MSVKTVTLSEDAYQALASLKGEHESFSEVVRRLTRTHRPLAEFAGAWAGVAESKVQDMERFWESANRLTEDKRRRERGVPRRRR